MSMTATMPRSALPEPDEDPLPPPPPTRWKSVILPVVMLSLAYGLLALTLSERVSHSEVMQRCVLVDDKMSRIWSVGNVEIGMSYFGVFGGMVWYFLGIYKRSRVHIIDLMNAIAYLALSFTLDAFCVHLFSPFIAMLLGDALVMTFTLIVSRQLWFKRLLGVFIPLIFLTCAMGHFLEGLSYWLRTYPMNVPWTMVTADIGFAVLLNASRFPAFIRGEDVIAELGEEKKRTNILQRQITAREAAEQESARLSLELHTSAERQRLFLRDVLSSVTENRLRLCISPEDLPAPLNDDPLERLRLESETLRDLRAAIRRANALADLPDVRAADLISAAGEASMNAVVHAEGGEATVYAERGRVQVWIVDKGRGISLEHLPRATLERGYTTAGSLGHGFWMMLQSVDRIYLSTGSDGTTVVIEQSREAPDEMLWMHRSSVHGLKAEA